MPKTERREILKMYGDAPVTVSVSIVTVALDVLPGVSKFFLKSGSKYVNTFGLSVETL